MRAGAKATTRRSSVLEVPDRIPMSGSVLVGFEGVRTRGRDPGVVDKESAPTPTPIGSGHEFAPIGASTSGATPVRTPDNPSLPHGGDDCGAIRRGERRSTTDDPGLDV
ncbi:hypothetical protein AB0B25_19575 [Nocardia sp. NPDC049190]|uniref:hypothetical protein n=1 Tax=Nocardia sp. NPDC049190 TaxID=3155650 RepID=UPI0033F7178C